MSIELVSIDPLTKDLKTAYRSYLATHAKEDREHYFGAIQRMHASYKLPPVDALNRSYYIYQAERISKETSKLASPAKAYCDRLDELEKALSQTFPQLKEKVGALARAHDAFLKQYIPEFERLNPNWKDRSVRIILVP